MTFEVKTRSFKTFLLSYLGTHRPFDFYTNSYNLEHYNDEESTV
jgi:hypothetical protein